MPPHTISVARPGRWGNPHPVGKQCQRCGITHTAREAVVEYLRDLSRDMENNWMRAEAVRSLRGYNLGCWCPVGSPCHREPLLALANGGPQWSTPAEFCRAIGSLLDSPATAGLPAPKPTGDKP
jgi:hypothetical protein